MAQRFIQIIKVPVRDIWIKERLRGLFLSQPRRRRSDFPNFYEVLMYDRDNPTTSWIVNFGPVEIKFTSSNLRSNIGALLIPAVPFAYFYIRSGEARISDTVVSDAITPPQRLLLTLRHDATPLLYFDGELIAQPTME